MPLALVLSGKATRCSARSKTTGDRCWNPAAYGMATCRYHGARRPQTVRKGPDHPQYKHGRETVEAKKARSAALGRLAELEELMAQTGQLAGGRTRGRKVAKASGRSVGSNATLY